MANLDLLEGEGLMERGQELEDVLGGALRALAGHELVGEVRAGIGAIAALGFTREALAAAPDLPFRVFAEVKARGVLARPLGDAVALSPPLVITAGRDRPRRRRDRRGARRGGAGHRRCRRGTVAPEPAGRP